MRIVSGRLRGRNIATPSGRNTRPTSDQTRESLFNILTHAEWSPDIEGAIVADIFAGSGALGLEAVSRGAEFCLFVETEPKARAAIRKNIETMGLFGCTRLHRQDATKLRVAPGNLRGTFTHVFMDPPYNRNLWQPVLYKLAELNLVDEKSLVILEVAAEEIIEAKRFAVLDERIWGAAKVGFLKIKS